MANNHGISVGQQFVLIGSIPSNSTLNGTFTATAVTANTVSWSSSSNPAGYTSLGGLSQQRHNRDRRHGSRTVHGHGDIPRPRARAGVWPDGPLGGQRADWLQRRMDRDRDHFEHLVMDVGHEPREP